ncbi:MAG: 2-phospho-L-lactate guanylyltransferase [Anaerolineales bacterium]
MSIWTIVPVKPFQGAKSRLAAVLPPSEREILSKGLLAQTLSTLAQVPRIEHTLVISRDPNALALARQYKVKTVKESGALDLNTALRHATEVALSFHVNAVLILPTDLPLLMPGDVMQMLELPGDGPTMVIAPDRHETGTNALFLRPPDLLPLAFGPNSFAKHLAQAAALGLTPRVCRAPHFALDLDTPDDWARYQQHRMPQSFFVG